MTENEHRTQLLTETAEAVDTPTGPEGRPRATIAVCVAWVAVYLAMAWCQGSLHVRGESALSGGVEPQVAHEFGTMSPAEVRGGEPWRALTATFVHFSLLHLGFNMLMLYQLGREVETWYGPGLFLGVYVVIGLGSNLIAAWLKPIWGEGVNMPSAGGSGVVCGLIGLVAVVGWRSRTRTGDFLRAQMVGLLVFVAIIGWLIPGVDNVVHGTGAVMGAAIGLFHRKLWPQAGKRPAKVIGVVAVTVTVACALAQARIGVVEAKAAALARSSQRRVEAITTLARIDQIYLQLDQFGAIRAPGVRIDPYSVLRVGRQLRESMERFESLVPRVGQGSSVEPFQRFRTLARQAANRLPRPGERDEFLRAERDLVTWLNREELREQREFETLRAYLRFSEKTPIRVLGPLPEDPNPGRGRPR
jgi:membrane associated rhomboid family serine protease